MGIHFPLKRLQNTSVSSLLRDETLAFSIQLQQTLSLFGLIVGKDGAEGGFTDTALLIGQGNYCRHCYSESKRGFSKGFTKSTAGFPIVTVRELSSRSAKLTRLDRIWILL